MCAVPHANRTSFRRLLLRKGVEVPLVRELTFRKTPSRRYGPIFRLCWMGTRGKAHRAVYYFCGNHPHLEVDGKELPTAELELRMYGMYKEKE